MWDIQVDDERGLPAHEQFWTANEELWEIRLRARDGTAYGVGSTLVAPPDGDARDYRDIDCTCPTALELCAELRNLAGAAAAQAASKMCASNKTCNIASISCNLGHSRGAYTKNVG